jgi:hypothetical protein
LREERKLRVFENKVLRRIFGPRRDEVSREWRRLRNEHSYCGHCVEDSVSGHATVLARVEQFC